MLFRANMHVSCHGPLLVILLPLSEFSGLMKILKILFNWQLVGANKQKWSYGQYATAGNKYSEEKKILFSKQSLCQWMCVVRVSKVHMEIQYGLCSEQIL